MFAMPFMINFAVFRPSEDRRGQYMALYTMSYGVAHIVAPWGSMYMADVYGFDVTYISLAVMCFFLTLGFYFLKSDWKTSEKS